MVHYLPTVNAALNATATVLLLLGLFLIKRGRETAHKRVMLSAFGVSILFLICYLAYHAQVGSVKFTGPSPVRQIYLTILGTHVVLAATVPFLAGRTLYLGLRDRRVPHRRLAKWTYPIWLYVSITGVVVYVMLYHLYPPCEGSRYNAAVGRGKRLAASLTGVDITTMSRQTKLCICVMLLAVGAVLLAPHVSHACPTCKDGLDANDPEHAGMAQGYFYSILIMMSMPYILLGSFGMYFWRQVKRAALRKLPRRLLVPRHRRRLILLVLLTNRPVQFTKNARPPNRLNSSKSDLPPAGRARDGAILQFAADRNTNRAPARSCARREIAKAGTAP